MKQIVLSSRLLPLFLKTLGTLVYLENHFFIDCKISSFYFSRKLSLTASENLLASLGTWNSSLFGIRFLTSIDEK